jgi:flagellin
MVITHNLSAMNAQRKLGTNVRNQSKTAEKLSSGYRINRAGDDSAGLAISEKMRSQIRGLEQGSVNSQDGISLIQTTEGAMSEVHSMLQRCKTLATQCANGTYQDKDREMANQELQEIKKDIDRIAKNTTFNGNYVLDGSLSSAGASTQEQNQALQGLNTWWISSAQNLVKNATGLDVPSGTGMKVVMDNNMASNLAAFVQYSNNIANPNLELHVSTAFIKGLDLTSDKDGKTGNIYIDRVIAHELTHATMAATTNMWNQPTWFTEGVAECVHGGDDRVEGILSNGLNTVSGLTSTLSSGWASNNDKYAAAYIATRYMNKLYETGAGNDGIKNILNQLKNNTSYTFDQALTAAKAASANPSSAPATASAFLSKLSSDINSTSDLLSLAKIDLTDADTGSLTGSDASGGAPLNASDIVPEAGSLNTTTPTGNSTIGNYSIEWGTPVTGKGMDIQVGGNIGDIISVTGGNVTCGALGIDNMDISSRSGAVDALAIIDTAINNVSTQRATLGATQNRLEHTITATDNTSENLTAAESRIRDADIAKEMMSYTKDNILTQAAQTMLAQANQQPNKILGLLQG